MMKYALKERLEKAAEGHKAIAGSESPNLFAEALTELKRLAEIESMVQALLRIEPKNGKGYRSPDHASMSLVYIEERFELGRKLGEAVGVFPARAK